jgi:hypothetical protein
MADVLALDPSRPEEAASHRRLRRLSSALALMIGGIAVLFALFLALIIGTGILQPDHVVMGTEGVSISFPSEPLPPLYHGAMRLSQLPLITWIAGGFALAINMAPIFLVLWHLRALFVLYASGIVFARENALHLKRIGLWLIAYPFAIFAGNTLFLLAGGADHKSWLHISEIQAPILGLIVFAIAQVMEFGREIEQEKDSFI